MLFTFYGSDVTRVRAEALTKAHEFVGAHSLQVLSPELVVAGALRDALGAVSLFGGYETYLLDSVSEDAEAFEILKKLLSELASSANHFVVIEGVLSVQDTKLFEREATNAFRSDGKETKEFNIFALTDALTARDKKTLWILLQEACRHRKSSEELIGTLFWQLKMLRLAEVTKSAAEAGQKPFVYDKAKRALTKFKGGEISTLMHTLVALYHDGHGGRRNIDHALEHWVLKI